jgi:hypothetical protein
VFCFTSAVVICRLLFSVPVFLGLQFLFGAVVLDARAPHHARAHHHRQQRRRIRMCGVDVLLGLDHVTAPNSDNIFRLVSVGVASSSASARIAASPSVSAARSLLTRGWPVPKNAAASDAKLRNCSLRST